MNEQVREGLERFASKAKDLAAPRFSRRKFILTGLFTLAGVVLPSPASPLTIHALPQEGGGTGPGGEDPGTGTTNAPGGSINMDCGPFNGDDLDKQEGECIVDPEGLFPE